MTTTIILYVQISTVVGNLVKGQYQFPFTVKINPLFTSESVCKSVKYRI